MLGISTLLSQLDVVRNSNSNSRIPKYDTDLLLWLEVCARVLCAYVRVYVHVCACMCVCACVRFMGMVHFAIESLILYRVIENRNQFK